MRLGGEVTFSVYSTKRESPGERERGVNAKRNAKRPQKNSLWTLLNNNGTAPATSHEHAHDNRTPYEHPNSASMKQ